MPLPEVWVQPSPHVDLKDFEDADAAAIRAGEIAVYDITVITARTDETWDTPDEWTVLDSCGNYYGAPGNDGIYADPRAIRDEFLRFYATDMWVYRLGIHAGDLIRHQGQTYAVLGLECEPYDLDPIGYATGYLVCRPTSGGAPVRLDPENATRKVLELTA